MRISVEDATRLLSKGEVVALPTETVYGLAASLSKPEAIENIFSLKGRPLANPLIIHVSSPQEVLHFAKELPPHFEALAQTFWPGPLTLILPVEETLVPALVRAHLSTAGFRIPNHPLTLEVLQAAGPLVMPSANLSGRPSATLPEHVEADFGTDFPVINGGPCQKGIESTVLSFQKRQWRIGRLGSLPPEAFEKVLGYVPELAITSDQPICPGQKFRHYAPKAQLLLGDRHPRSEGICVVGFEERDYKGAPKIVYLGSLFNPESVAENLYQALRYLDEIGIGLAWVDMDFPEKGLWKTLRERLLKAGQQIR